MGRRLGDIAYRNGEKIMEYRHLERTNLFLYLEVLSRTTRWWDIWGIFRKAG